LRISENSARLQVLASALLFATTGTAKALGPDAASAVTVGAMRIVIGGGLLALLARFTGGWSGPWRMPLVLVCGVGVVVYQVAFFEAVSRTGVGVGAVVAIGSGPMFAGIFGRFAEGHWPDRRWALAAGFAVAGVSVLTITASDDRSLSVAGIALALVSGAGYAFYTVVAKRLLADGRSPIGVMGAAFGIGALMMVPFLIAGDTRWLRSVDGVALAVYLGVFPTALAYFFFARGLQVLPAATVTTLVLAEPLGAMLLGVTVLDERVGPAKLLGALTILVGLSMFALPERRRT
jgi:drug/metabolite transporter, DME family